MSSGFQNSGVPYFGHFLEYLRLNKFTVGVTQYVRLQQVLDLLAKDFHPEDPEYLKSLLCPVFAISEEEQRKFSKVYDDYIEYCRKNIGPWKVAPTVGREVELKVEHVKAEGEARKSAQTRGWRDTLNNLRTSLRRVPSRYAIAAIVLGAMVFVAVAYLLTSHPPGRNKIENRRTTSTTNGESESPAPASPTRAPLATPTPTPVTAPTLHRPPPRFYLAVATMLLLLPLLYAWLRRSLRSLDPKNYENKKPPFTWHLPVTPPRVVLFDSENFRRAARLLRRRQVDEFFRLDIGATVSATIRSLGYPSLRYKRATRVPEYLALIERKSPHDHQAHFFDEMVKALRSEGLNMTRYFYDDDPHVCRDESGEHYVRLEKLKHRHAGHRLLLFGSGEHLLDPLTGRLTDWARVFFHWHERAVLTPESNWGWREHILSEQFLVVPANERGLLTLVTRVESPAGSSISWLSPDTKPLPRDTEGSHALEALRPYLGEQLFQWLGSCAVYKELRWEMTLTLGSLRSMPKGVINTENLLRLSRLPWFRAGAIPDAVRSDLIEALDPALRDETRSAIVSLMENNLPPADTFASDIYRLELAQQRWLLRDDRASLRELRGALKRLPSRQVSRSKVLAHFLRAVPHKFFGLRLPQVFYRRGIPALGLSAMVQIVLALALLAATLGALRARAEKVPLWAYAFLVTATPTPSPGGSPPATQTPTESPGKIATPTTTATTQPTTTPSLSPSPSPGPLGLHCGDSPPANPKNCKLNIDQPFNVGCNLPFSGGQSHDIDLHCPNEGCAKTENDKAQNRIKNNLCATGTPVQISVTSIDKLQAAVDQLVQQGKISYGDTGPPQPADRAKLQGLSTVDINSHAVTLGEGNLVTLDAFVLDAKHDDTYVLGQEKAFAGEGVNCNNSLFDWNDIHIALGQTASAQECSSVTAEIIPHFRPAVWDRFDTNACTSPHVTNPLPVGHLKVRITGQLFFDGSHRPAPCNAPSVGHDPERRSVWEIHPVYAIEVFDTDRKTFVTLEEWARNK